MRTTKINLENKTIVVTGALGILGKKFCSGLAESGANLALIDLADSDNGFCEELSKSNKVQCEYFQCDTTKEGEIKEAIQSIRIKFGSIDALHNNAASKSWSVEEFYKPLEDFSVKAWNQIMTVNVTGYFLMAREVAKVMISQANGGSIIQTASVYGVVAPDQRIYEGSEYNGLKIGSPAVYSASKAAVIGLTQYLSTYWGEKNIRVNTITPGGVESGQNKLFKNKYSARVPLGRMADPEEIVGALIFLASDASSYITGQNIIIDGGLTTW